ncbi:MAK10-like protein [Tanacetum coccineum]
MERFKNTIFKQREEINGRMTEMFRLLKELTTSRTPEKVLIGEEAKFHIIKNLNSISLTKGEEGGSNRTMLTPGNVEKPTETKIEMPVMEVEKINEVENVAKLIKTSENEEVVEAPAGKKKGKEYKVLPEGPPYNAILKKIITKKEDTEGNFDIPCSLGNLKHVNALVDQGSDVNVMPYSTYTKLTDERPAETNIRLSLASYSYIYPLGIAKDVLVEITEHVYPLDVVILDIRENKNRPFILGTLFLTIAKASIKFDTDTITLRSGKHKASPGMEKKTKLHLEREMQFNQWRSNNFKGIHPTLISTKEEEDNEEEVTYLAFGRHLDELHVTWAHLEKKRTRLQTNTKTLEDLCSQSLETASQAIYDAVTTHQVTTSDISRRRQTVLT